MPPILAQGARRAMPNRHDVARDVVIPPQETGEIVGPPGTRNPPTSRHSQRRRWRAIMTRDAEDRAGGQAGHDPVRPGRGSMLAGKTAVVTGGARGIGRAIAVELAANGADVVALDIAGPVSPASDAVPATPDELAGTVRQIRGYGRRGDAIRADIRDIAALRAVADQVEQAYGKIDIVVADAAIQRWKPLLEMQDSDWRRMIDNNLNGTLNTIRAFAPKMVPRRHGRIIPPCRAGTAPGTRRATRRASGASWA
jgi:NADP-dependent 3-hydroxy acid dehydrogenase YdfG